MTGWVRHAGIVPAHSHPIVDNMPEESLVGFVGRTRRALEHPGLDATLRADADGPLLVLGARALARAVRVDFGDLDVQLSDNALTLLPGERVTLRLSSAAP